MARRHEKRIVWNNGWQRGKSCWCCRSRKERGQHIHGFFADEAPYYSHTKVGFQSMIVPPQVHPAKKKPRGLFWLEKDAGYPKRKRLHKAGAEPLSLLVRSR